MMKLRALAARCASVKPTKIHAALPLLLMGMLYGVSSLPGSPLPNRPTLYSLFSWMSPIVQNILHVPAFAALTLAWLWTLRAWMHQSDAQTFRIRAIGAVALTSVYAIFDEFHQSFVPGRYASMTDVVLDVAGATLGILLAKWVSRYGSDSTFQGASGAPSR